MNAQRRARRGSTIRRFTNDEQAAIQQRYAQREAPRILADEWGTTYSTINRIIDGTYTGARYVFETSPSA